MRSDTICPPKTGFFHLVQCYLSAGGFYKLRMPPPWPSRAHPCLSFPPPPSPSGHLKQGLPRTPGTLPATYTSSVCCESRMSNL